jgi:hypothetical protein
MPKLRELAEKDLSLSLEGDWGVPVALLSPDGVWQRTGPDGLLPLCGQVLYDIKRLNPDTGESVVVPTPVVSLRRSSLIRVPQPGEGWLVEIPSAPVAGAPIVQYTFSPMRAPEGGGSIGFIRLYLQEVEQTPAP